MSLDSISDALEKAHIPPADFNDLTTDWNGKGVQVLHTDQGVWLVRKIPFNSQGIYRPLVEKITSVNSKLLDSVEQVLERHNLKFAPTTLGQRDVVVLELSDYAWIMMPLLKVEADSLEGKITEVDAIDSEAVRVALENKGIFLSSVPETDPYFVMTRWV